MPEMLVALLARLPNPLDWVSRAARDGGVPRIGLAAFAGLMVFFIIWKLLAGLAGKRAGRGAGRFLLAAAAAAAVAVLIIGLAPRGMG